MGKKNKRATLVLQDTYIESILNNKNQNQDNLKEILKKYKEETDKKNKDEILSKQIIPKFKNFITKLISKYKTFDKEDLEQIAYIAIIKATQNYQQTYDNPTNFFLSYIEKEIKHYIMKEDIIKIPKTVRKLYYQIQKYISSDPSISIQEIAQKLNLKEESVKEILSIPQKNNIDINLIKSQKMKDLQLRIEDKIFFEQIIKNLSEIEKKVINFIFFEDLSKTNLAQKLNISRKHIYTILNKIKEKLFPNI